MTPNICTLLTGRLHEFMGSEDKPITPELCRISIARGFDACRRCPEAAGMRLKERGIDIE